MARLESAINIALSELGLMRWKFLVCGCQALLNFLLWVCAMLFCAHNYAVREGRRKKTGNFYADLPEE